MGELTYLYPPLTANEQALVDEMAEMAELVTQAQRLLVVYRYLLDAVQNVVNEALWQPMENGVARRPPTPLKPSDEALERLGVVARVAERAYNPWRDQKPRH